jgi:hypothetical protein
MLKNKTGFAIGILASLFTCGCGQLSTNSQDVGQIMHKQSTLSTEQSTNVDNITDNTDDLLITYEESSENRTENETNREIEIRDETDASGENDIREETDSSEKIEISGESETEKNGEIQQETQGMSDECPEQSTECQEQSTEYKEETTEGHTETLSEEEEELQEVFSDAAYYYSFYASIFHSRDESTSLTFDRETFEHAYENVKAETLKDYFESCQWLSREEGISLSLTPKTCLFPDGNADVYSWEARCIHAFALLRAAYETDEHWDNGNSLKPQFHCHAIYARQNKVPWNIEPYRTETSFLRILLTWGNPES